MVFSRIQSMHSRAGIPQFVGQLERSSTKVKPFPAICIPKAFLMPFFAFANRIHNTVSLLQEALLKSHLDTSMAPYWTVRKTKF